VITASTLRGSDEASTTPGRFDRDVGAGADGEADICTGQRGGVVDAVTDHCDSASPFLEFGHGAVLVLVEDLGEHLVDAELVGDVLGDRVGVAGDHHDVDAPVVQRVDSKLRLRTDLVFERERPDDLTVVDDVQDGGASCFPLIGAL
jgi:hypothetical protein